MCVHWCVAVQCAMEERCFNTLRTLEQLSYSVSSGVNETNGVLGFSINVAPPAAKHTLVNSSLNESIRRNDTVLHFYS